LSRFAVPTTPTVESTMSVFAWSIGGPYSCMVTPAVASDSQYVCEAAVTSLESPRMGTMICTSTPRSSAMRSAASSGSSGIRYGVSIHTRLRAVEIAARKNAWIGARSSSGPEPRICTARSLFGSKLHGGK
jgi:hypothetical protein